MNRALKLLAPTMLLILAATPLRAGYQEVRTVRTAGDVLNVLCVTTPRDIAPELVRSSAGVAIVPQILKVGMLVGGQFGRGIVMTRRPDGTWNDPVFISLSTRSIGGQAGIGTSDMVLVFRTKSALEQALHGSVKLGGDAAVAVGPLAGQADGEVSTDWGKGDVICIVKSRGGLFAGVSFEGAWLKVDTVGNQAFYGNKRSPEAITALDLLRIHLVQLGLPPPPVVTKPLPGAVPKPPPPPGTRPQGDRVPR